MKYKRICVLTGAGISAESGLKTFRGSDGLWEGHRVEEVATPEAFEANPALVQEFYNMRRRQLLSDEVSENLAHQALAQFEKQFSGDFLLVTQNIDDLHERAGSQNIRHIHGELLKVRHLHSNEVKEHRSDLPLGDWRPHIVWFGEVPFHLEEIFDYLEKTDLFVAVGTSGLVYPAAGLVNATPDHCYRVEINLEKTPVSPHFHEKILGLASQKVPEFLESLL